MEAPSSAPTAPPAQPPCGPLMLWPIAAPMPPPTMAPSTGSAADAGVDRPAVATEAARAARSTGFLNIVGSPKRGFHDPAECSKRHHDPGLRPLTREASNRLIGTAHPWFPLSRTTSLPRDS